MRQERRRVVFGSALAFVALALVPATASSAREPAVRRGVRLLVQSELDYLPAAGRRVTLEFDKAEPAAVLGQIRERSGLVIEVRGSLPSGPRLSGSHRDQKLKAVLDWFALEVPVSFRAEPPNTLWVIVDPPSTSRDGRPTPRPR